MNNYYIEETEFTPEIKFDLDHRRFSFIGVSRPEDVIKFFQPAITWLKELDENIHTHTNVQYNIPILNIDFHLSYFNSSSSKMLLQILELIKKIQSKGIEIKVDWYYEENDETMYEDGVDLSESVDLPFNFKAIA